MRVILFRWNACWSNRSDAFWFRHTRRPCCSCRLKETLYSKEVLLKFKSLAPKISRAPRMWVYNNDTSRSRQRIVKARVKHVRQFCNLCSYDCRGVKTKAITSKQWHLWTAINQAANALKGGENATGSLNAINCLQTLLSAVKILHAIVLVGHRLWHCSCWPKAKKTRGSVCLRFDIAVYLLASKPTFKIFFLLFSVAGHLFHVLSTNGL